MHMQLLSSRRHGGSRKFVFSFIHIITRLREPIGRPGSHPALAADPRPLSLSNSEVLHRHHPPFTHIGLDHRKKNDIRLQILSSRSSTTFKELSSDPVFGVKNPRKPITAVKGRQGCDVLMALVVCKEYAQYLQVTQPLRGSFKGQSRSLINKSTGMRVTCIYADISIFAKE